MHGTQAVRLPTYESLTASNLAGFTNPRYGAEGMGDVVESEGEGGGGGEVDIDDRPPPYSPGIVGQQPGI